MDAEYERGAAVNLLLFCEPLAGRRWVDVTGRRTRADRAHRIETLVDVRYPDAERIVPAQGHLNTHGPASLSEAFPLAEAERLADRPEIHHTPRHGWWLNMAEIGLGMLRRQYLDRRVPDLAALRAEVAALQGRRNADRGRSSGASRPPTRAPSCAASTPPFTSNAVPRDLTAAAVVLRRAEPACRAPVAADRRVRRPS